MHSNTAVEIQRRLDDLLDHLPAGVVVHGADGRIVSANKLACELLGQSPQQLKGTEASAGAWELLRSDGTPMPSEQFPVNVVLRTGSKISHLIVGIPGAPGTQPRWLICNAYPGFDAAGHLREAVVCFTDCTLLKRAKQRLQKSEQCLRLVLRGSTDAPWDNDLVRGEFYYSERWWHMLGYRPDELAPHAGLWLDLVHPDERPGIDAFMAALAAERRESYAIEFRLRHRDGHYVPVLSRGFVRRDSTGKPLRISGTNTDLSERKRAERHIYELAYFDQLTGLPNRRLLIEELDKTLARSHRSGRLGALVFLDLDNFKLINDTMGHAAGDALLRQVAGRLRQTLRQSDHLARLGGDEFVLVLEELGGSGEEAVREAGIVVDKLKLVLDQPYSLDGRPFVSTPSMGWCCSTASRATSTPCSSRQTSPCTRPRHRGATPRAFSIRACRRRPSARPRSNARCARACRRTSSCCIASPSSAAAVHCLGPRCCCAGAAPMACCSGRTSSSAWPKPRA